MKISYHGYYDQNYHGYQYYHDIVEYVQNVQKVLIHTEIFYLSKFYLNKEHFYSLPMKALER